jgi:VanZ family protein
MTRTARVLLALVGLALPQVLVATSVAARYTRETPADIVAMRGMPVALGVCLVGLLLLCFVPIAGAATPPSAAVPGARRSRWVTVGVFVVFIFATVPVGFQIAAFIVARIGSAGWRNGINGVGVILALLFLWYVFRQRELRRWSVVVSLASIAAVYAYFFTILEVPVKRIHFMEYSFLSYLVHRALRPRSAPPRIYLWCVLAAMLVGIGEEALSLPLARRFGAVSDVLWDTSGGMLGALVLKYVLRKR